MVKKTTSVVLEKRMTRVSEREREALERLAQVEDLNLSAALRLAIRESCAKRGLWPIQTTVKTREAQHVQF